MEVYKQFSIIDWLAWQFTKNLCYIWLSYIYVLRTQGIFIVHIQGIYRSCSGYLYRSYAEYLFNWYSRTWIEQEYNTLRRKILLACNTRRSLVIFLDVVMAVPIRPIKVGNRRGKGKLFESQIKREAISRHIRGKGIVGSRLRIGRQKTIAIALFLWLPVRT